MTHRAPTRLLAAALLAAPLAACSHGNSAASLFRHERRIFITSDPAGAAVRLNEREVGETPLETDFTWFGTYDVVLTHPGYEPLITSEKASPKVHDWPAFDLITGALPYVKRTHMRWHFTLTPHTPDTDALLTRAQDLRTSFPEPAQTEPAPPESSSPEPEAPPTE